MLPIHAGSTIGDQFCRILQTLQGFATMSFFMRLLRAHLEGLSNQQLENQFQRVCKAVIYFQDVRDSLDQIYRLLAGRQDLTGSARETFAMGQRILFAADEITSFSGQISGGSTRSRRMEFGSNVSQPWRSICKLIESPEGAYHDYKSVAYTLFLQYGCGQICRRGTNCAEKAGNLESVSLLIEQLQISLQNRSLLLMEVDLSCATAQEELWLIVISVMSGAAKVKRQKTYRRALVAVRDLLEIGNQLSTCLRPLAGGDEQWPQVETNIGLCLQELGKVQPGMLFQSGDSDLPLTITRLARVRELLQTAQERIRSQR